jgi:putative phage-type endonuclease
MVLKPETNEEWLKERKNGIGGSDAGTVLGVNKYKSNVELWLEKTGQSEPEDISDKPAVKFGKFAEQHLRELFKQDFPDYQVDYHEFWMYQNDKYPFIYATLDGEIIAPDGSRGILEIKTTTIRNKDQWDEWEDKIPDSYYAQVLHQLVATGWSFAVLKAYIRYYKDGELRVSIRHYRIDRKDKEAEMQYLIECESKFWASVKSKTRPALLLPEI